MAQGRLSYSIGHIRAEQLRGGRGNLLVREHRQEVELAGIDDHRFRSLQLGGDSDLRMRRMRFDELAGQGRGQQRIGYKEQH